jgi:hypothetical protein
VAICLLIILIFGIVSVSLFKQKSFFCNTLDDGIGLTQLETEKLIQTEIDCLNYGGLWDRHENHFDDIMSAMQQMLIMAQSGAFSD